MLLKHVDSSDRCRCDGCFGIFSSPSHPTKFQHRLCCNLQDETWENLFESAGLEVKLMISPPALEKEAAVQEFLKDKVGELLTFNKKTVVTPTPLKIHIFPWKREHFFKGNFMFQPSFSEGQHLDLMAHRINLRTIPATEMG